MSISETTEQIRHERDQFRILVDITNSVLSHLEMDGLVAEVSREIYRFLVLAKSALPFVIMLVQRFTFVIQAIINAQNLLKKPVSS